MDEEMQDYVITFAKVGLKNGWVRVTARSEEIARAWAFREYGQMWSGLYAKETHFDGNELCFYPLGELGHTTLHYERAEHV